MQKKKKKKKGGGAKAAGGVEEEEEEEHGGNEAGENTASTAGVEAAMQQLALSGGTEKSEKLTTGKVCAKFNAEL